MYDPEKFLDRTYRHFRILGEAKYPDKGNSSKTGVDLKVIQAFLTICWRQGLVRKTRYAFWRNLFNMYRYNRGGISSYLSTCAQIEHFLEYREIVKAEIESQLAEFLAEEAKIKAQPPQVNVTALAS